MAIAYRREIDGLRAIAVGAVVLFHAGVWPRGGFVGVDVFFVISGYLITALLLREHAQTDRIDLLAFYARRVRRIFPAAVLVVLVTLALSAVLLTPPDLEVVANSAAAAAVFGANLFFRAVTGGYWSADAESMPLLHLWSLSVEEQFYFLWPALLLAVLRWRPRWLVPGLAGLAIASLAYAEWLLQRDPTAAFYVMPARWWELAVGGLIAASPASGRCRALVWGGLALTVGACALPLVRFPGLGALPAVAGAGALLWAVHRGQDLGLPGRLLRSAPMVGLGLVSYSLYLWHWPLLALYRATSIGPGDPTVRLSLCALALLLAIASYRYVEQPFRRLRAPSGRFVATGAAASLCLALGACGLAYRSHTEAPIAEIAHPLAVIAADDFPAQYRACHELGVGREKPIPNPACNSRPGTAPTVAVWGDSFGTSWQSYAWELAELDGRAATAYHADSCPPLLGYVPAPGAPADVHCRDRNARIVASLRGFDTVVVALRWGRYFPSPEASRGLRATLDALAPTVRQVIVIGPTPVLADKAPKCLASDDPQACAIRLSDFRSWSAGFSTELAAAARAHPNVQVLDPTAFLCTPTCGPSRAGVALYIDDAHLSSTGSRAVALWERGLIP